MFTMYKIKRREEETIEEYLIRRWKRHHRKLKGHCSIAETDKLWSAIDELGEILEGLGIKIDKVGD